MPRIYKIFRDLLTWLFGGVLIALIGEFAIELAREHGFFEQPTAKVEAALSLLSMVQTYSWFWPSLSALGGLVMGMWLDNLARGRIARGGTFLAAATTPPGPDQGYTDDPEAEATDKQAYKEILAFAQDRVLPACDAQIRLQEALISQTCATEKIANLAHVGLRHDGSHKTSEFWVHYNKLLSGLIESPGPIIKFEAIIDCIAGLERENYRNFCEQRHEIAAAASINPEADVSVRSAWLEWASSHNTLVDAYEPIKRDPRFGKLLRPVRPSRWGDIQPLPA
jgi:hypothetical protein